MRRQKLGPSRLLQSENAVRLSRPLECFRAGQFLLGLSKLLQGDVKRDWPRDIQFRCKDESFVVWKHCMLSERISRTKGLPWQLSNLVVEAIKKQFPENSVWYKACNTLPSQHC